MTDFVLGLDAKIYRNSATYESPTWVEIDNVKDLTLNLTKEEADVTTRANNGWKAIVASLKEGSIDFEMVWNKSDSNFQALLASFLTNSVIDFLILDGPYDTAGSEGLRASCQVFNFSRAEQLTDVLRASVTIKPTYSAHPPVWHVAEGESSSSE